ncbi:MAG: hypothetical protein ACWGSQ_15325, partial [Longimicrobiales bacterium]
MDQDWRESALISRPGKMRRLWLTALELSALCAGVVHPAQALRATEGQDTATAMGLLTGSI